MKRLARLGGILGIAAVLLMAGARGVAFATPFSDVPGNQWAYEYIQSLAADGVIDGYPDGTFKGDRPLTRYEMAVIVARVIAKLQENEGRGVSKEDLDKVQKLIDALKDELDSLGVRVTNLEDALDALDRRTKFAQALSMHGAFLPNVSFRERIGIPETIVNTTGTAVTTYNGVTVPAGGGTNPTAVAPISGAAGSVDPFVNAYLATDDTNNPLTQANSGILIRQDSRFSLSYQVSDNLVVSLPVHILNYEYGGDFTQQALVDIEPTVDIRLAQAGAISNLDFKYGVIDTMASSRLGLAFRAPQGYNGAVPYEQPYQPPQKGVFVSGTVGEGAFGLTDFEASFTRVDNVLINTQPAATSPNIAPFTVDNYYFPVVVNQITYTQTTPAGSLKTDTFNAGTGTLSQVFLTAAAVDGSVYISFYNGATYTSDGTQSGGAAIVPVPGFTFNSSYNSVVFTTPIPPGSVVKITYKSLGLSNNSSFQRYMLHARVNQSFKGYAGGQIGVTVTRVFDFDDAQSFGSGPSGTTIINASSPTGYGLVSDTVLGLDFQAPLPFDLLGPDTKPILFGEFAESTFTPNYTTVAAVSDAAGVAGIRLKFHTTELTAQYQDVGSNFFVGAPYEYYGNAPALFSSYRGLYVPDFFGFGNDVGINQQYDKQFTAAGLVGPYSPSLGVGGTAGNPNLTFAYPIFNLLRATGPAFYSAFAPNSRGEVLTLASPVRLGAFGFVVRGSYSHLEEIRPDGYGGMLAGPAYAPDKPERYDTYTAGSTFSVPVFGTTASFNLSGTYETLVRADERAFAYTPFNPATQTVDATALAAAEAAFGGSLVSYYPNYVNVRHIVIAANASFPLTKDVNLTGSYSTQRFGGAYGTTLTQNISERKNYYTGGLTYNIPHTNSSLSFLERHYQYNDAVVQNFNFVQNRQDINFTVRF
jgi:hypothetical protein